MAIKLDNISYGRGIWAEISARVAQIVYQMPRPYRQFGDFI
ncbi:hypothetical protein [Oscillatoria sp. FACHB-1407]|nr:hypothetical protein [Oscillatoria sp. FACHB-1407]